MRSRWAACLGVMTACASGPRVAPTPDPRVDAEIRAAVRLPADPPPRWRPKTPRSPIAARPAIQLPTMPVEPVTWPLVTPPAMAPHAHELLGAAPGCVAADGSVGARYAAAWCLIRRSRAERAAAADALFALAGELSGDARVAVVRDLAEVLVDTASPAAVLARLGSGTVRGLRDALIATYVETGDPDAAAQLALARGPEPTTDCHGLLRDADLTGDRTALDADATCAPLVQAAACGRTLARLARTDRYFTVTTAASSACRTVIARGGAAGAIVELSLAYHAWPAGPGWAADWLAVADHAEQGLPTPGAALLAATALDNAAAVADCSPATVTAIHEHALRIADAFPDEPARTERLRALTAFAPTCDLVGETL